jgi:hypothetical protein
MSQGFTKGTPIDTDPTLSLNSDIVVPSQAAVVAYIASQIGTPVTSVTATSPILSSGGSAPNISIPVATSLVNGYLSATDWATFNGKQNAITLTTTGSSGASTFIANTLNVPNYTLAGLGGVPTTRTLTIDGVTLDLSANRSWSTSGSRSSALVATPSAPVGANTTTFTGLSAFSYSTENVRISAFGVPVTASAITIITNNSQGLTASLVITLRVNTADTSLSCTIAGGSGPGVYPATGSVSVGANDRVAIKLQNNITGGSSATIVTITTIWTI